jgi:hypothetical protein
MFFIPNQFHSITIRMRKKNEIRKKDENEKFMGKVNVG